MQFIQKRLSESQFFAEYKLLLRFMIRWLVLGSGIGTLCGLVISAFIYALFQVTDFRVSHLWIIALLPFAGMATGWLYTRLGRGSEKGSDLIIDEVLEFRGKVLFRMAPLILFSTLLAHLFGGSAGREGTAVQIGGALASKMARMLKLIRREAQMLMMAGISGGFSAIFGTPVAGAIFGMEVISRGEIRFASALACVSSAVVANLIAHNLTPVHETYHVPIVTSLDIVFILKLLVATIPFAFAAALFSEFTHYVAHKSSKMFTNELWRPFAGGIAVLLLFAIFQDSRYLGLSLPLVQDALNGQHFPIYAFAIKIIFTSITLGSGFRGGDVFPLFVIGALLGSALGPILHIDSTMLAAIGFVGVFASASKTPIAATVMGIEIFGTSYAVPFLLTNFIGYMLTGHSGIYTAQRPMSFGFEEPEVAAVIQEAAVESLAAASPLAEEDSPEAP